MRNCNRTARNSFLLFLTASIWGMAFVSQSKGMEYMHPLTFNGVRALIGAFVLLLYIGVTRGIAGHHVQPVNWRVTIKAGLLCGIALTVASTLQQFGVLYTTVGKAGFITALYIIFVPVGGVFLHRKVSPVVWTGAVLAAMGMYLLCMSESLALEMGDVLVFLCAIVFAAHIMIVDHYSEQADGVIVSCIQFGVCGVVCGTAALIWGQPSLEQLRDGSGALLYAGVLSCGVAYTLQIVGQKGVNPTVAALIMSLESVVATVAGWAAYKMGLLGTDQSMTPRQILGCVIVFLAVVLVQLPREWILEFCTYLTSKCRH